MAAHDDDDVRTIADSLVEEGGLLLLVDAFDRREKKREEVLRSLGMRYLVGHRVEVDNVEVPI